jgi:hypothetical protein
MVRSNGVEVRDKPVPKLRLGIEVPSLSLTVGASILHE